MKVIDRKVFLLNVLSFYEFLLYVYILSRSFARSCPSSFLVKTGPQGDFCRNIYTYIIRDVPNTKGILNPKAIMQI